LDGLLLSVFGVHPLALAISMLDERVEKEGIQRAENVEEAFSRR
jgi:hypothetical protein